MTHACGTHAAYRLTCDEYDVLVDAHAGECAICGLPADLTIDHDHAVGLSAVRGLLCRTCNVGLAAVDAGEREPTWREAFYLRYAWHLTHRTQHVPDNRTKPRNLRVPDPEWQSWQESARAAGTTLTDYVRTAAAEKQARERRKKR